MCRQSIKFWKLSSAQCFWGQYHPNRFVYMGKTLLCVFLPVPQISACEDLKKVYSKSSVSHTQD